jgi:hypothetical protein
MGRTLTHSRDSQESSTELAGHGICTALATCGILNGVEATNVVRENGVSERPLGANGAVLGIV